MSLRDRLLGAPAAAANALRPAKPAKRPPKRQAELVAVIDHAGTMKLVVLRPNWSGLPWIRIEGGELAGFEFIPEHPENVPDSVELPGVDAEERKSCTAFIPHDGRGPIELPRGVSAGPASGHLKALRRLTATTKYAEREFDLGKVVALLREAEELEAEAQRNLDDYTSQRRKQIMAGQRGAWGRNEALEDELARRREHADMCRQAVADSRDALDKRKAETAPDPEAIAALEADASAMFEELRVACETVVRLSDAMEPLKDGSLRARARRLLGGGHPLVGDLPWADLEHVRQRLDHGWLVWTRRDPDRWRK